MIFTLLAHQVGPQTLNQVSAGEANFIFTRLRLPRDLHAAVKAPDHLVRPISAAPIGAVPARREFGWSRRIRIMSPIGINEL
jgi:hypothetical protein